MRFLRIVFAITFAALAWPGRAQSPERLLDLNPGPDDGLYYYWWWNPPEHLDSFIVPLGGELLFSGDDGVHGGELWRTDGTLSGTVLVADLLPGPMGSLFQGGEAPYRLGGLLFFGADAASGVRELWRTDGTARGTRRLIGAPNAFSFGLSFAAGDMLYFPAMSPAAGWELWASDGTPEGTYMVADLLPGPESSGARPLAALGETLLFSAQQPPNGTELWVSDGTAAGTFEIADLSPGPESTLFDALAVLGGEALVFARTGSATSALYRTDAATPAVMLHEFAPQSVTTATARLGSAIWFAALDAVHGPSLWRSDGTPEGTVVVRDLSGAVVADPRHVATLGERLLVFDAHRLWRTDGGPASELRAFDCTECEFALFETPSYLFFSVTSLDDGAPEPRFPDLWRTDGTAAGTVLLSAGAAGVLHGAVWTGERLYFAGYREDVGTELWSSDGTAGGTALVADLDPGSGSSQPMHLTLFDGRLYFSAIEQGFGRELWSMSLGETPGAAPVSGYTTLGGDLVRLDLASGEARPVGPVGFDLADLAFDPDQRLFGLTSGGELVRLDTTTGAGSRVAPIDLSDPAEQARALTFDACGDLWITSHSAASAASNLYAADPVTGAATLVGTSEHELRTLTARGRELLGLADYGPAGVYLVDVDPVDAGLSGRRRGPGLAGRPFYAVPEWIDFDERGFLWGIDTSDALLTPAGLDLAQTWVLDPVTGAARETSSANERSYSGLAVGRPPGRCPAGACRPGAARHCLLDGRFQAEVGWRDFQGQTGAGRAVPGASDDSGLFFFFGPENWELMVKTLDGCAVNGHFWVFAAASTNVEFQLRITDTATGEARTYSNPLGQTAETVADTQAFASCP